MTAETVTNRDPGWLALMADIERGRDDDPPPPAVRPAHTAETELLVHAEIILNAALACGPGQDALRSRLSRAHAVMKRAALLLAAQRIELSLRRPFTAEDL